jgi:HPt (histidine-containing phosphotransfer) domain-containing protein
MQEIETMVGDLKTMVLDRTVALARVGGDVELLKEIATLFLDEYPRVLTDLHKALQAGDSKGVERSAHGLKGSVSNFGAQAVVDAAFQLEQLGRAQKLAEVSQVLTTLELALAALHTELASI